MADKAPAVVFAHFNICPILNQKAHRAKCPHCGWEGMVIPKFGMGCPKDGIWWYKEKTSVKVVFNSVKRVGKEMGASGVLD